jgi:signal transduction histidine kinase/ActR/RegA family two-component response regulator
MAQLADSTMGSVRLWDAQAQGLRPVATYNQPVLAILRDGMGMEAFRMGKPVVADHYASHPKARDLAISHGRASTVAVPMRAGGRVIGAVILGSDKLKHFSSETVQVLAVVADHIGADLEIMRLLEEERGRATALQESEQRALKTTQASLVQAEKLAALGELMAGAAHELNNPLSIVVGLAQLRLTGDLDTEIRKDWDQIESAGWRAARVVDNMRAFAQKEEVQAAPLNLNTILNVVLEIKSYHLQVSNIQVEKELAPDIPDVLADATQIETVFLNLINNAEKAMTGATGPGTLWIKTEHRGDMVRVAVADNGPGVRPEHITKVFDPFFTTSDVGEGMGMGLSICHGIVIRHQGRIWVESEYGKGATFYVGFPAAQRMVEGDGDATTEPDTPAATPTPARILVIDDEPGARDLLSEVLGGVGYDVEAVDSGRKALELLDNATYDLLLVDMKMPGMNGREILQSLSDRMPMPRVIFVTGDTATISTQRFLKESEQPVIFKPFDLEELNTLVAEELGKRS